MIQKIHRIWLGPRDMPDVYREYGEKWAELNPGWEVIDWDWDMLKDANLANFDLAAACGSDSFPANPGAGKQDTAVQVQRADILSYSLVFKFGGVYVNCDMEPRKPIMGIFAGLLEDGFEAATSWELPDKALSNAFLWAAEPGHSFWFDCVAQLPERVRMLPGQAMNIQTGPWLLTEVYDQSILNDLNVPAVGSFDRGRATDVFVFDAELFHPYLWNETHREYEKHPDAIVVHHWGHKKADRVLWPGEVSGDGKVVVCWLAPGEVRNEFMSSILTAWATMGHRIPSAITRNSGPLIDVMRNRLVREFLKTPHEWMLMLDADMMLEDGCISTLLETADPIERPIVGGLAFGRDPDGVIFPTMYRMVGENSEFARAENVPPNTLVSVDATGCAVLLVHRKVFESVQKWSKEPYVWFQETQIGDRVVGEDITFCLRARNDGYPIYVHTGAKTVHMKDVGLDLKLHEKWRADNHFVVTGAGRVGTMWMSKLFTGFMMACSHEEVFHPLIRDYIDDVDWGGWRGDASWLAAPHLRLARLDRTKIVQVVREPLATVSSMLAQQFYDDWSDDEYPEHWWQYRMYQEEYLFNGSDAPEWTDLSPLERAMFMYVKWNRMIEPYAHLRVPLEQLRRGDVVRTMLKQMGYDRTEEDCGLVAAALPVENESPPHRMYEWNDMPDSDLKVELQRMASDYGYLKESANGRNDQ